LFNGFGDVESNRATSGSRPFISECSNEKTHQAGCKEKTAGDQRAGVCLPTERDLGSLIFESDSFCHFQIFTIQTLAFGFVAR
jgi:hypothetical protein